MLSNKKKEQWSAYYKRNRLALIAKVRARQSKYKAKGLCITCGKNASVTRLCDSCRKAIVPYSAARILKRKELGCCQSCGRTLDLDVDTPGVCIPCKEKATFYQRIHGGSIL